MKNEFVDTEDFDIWQKAINSMDLTESAAPIVRGVMLMEDSQVEMYNKIQKLLNTSGMECCHRFLYNLDPSELTESEAIKVANLYQLGVDRGFIAPEKDEEDDEDGGNPDEPGDSVEIANSTTNKDTTVAQSLPSQPLAIKNDPANTAPQAAYTVLYSAMRNGQIKSGEAFSNSVNTYSAKADVISKLERAGYSDIQILAIEAGDPDARGCDNTYCAQKAEVPDYFAEADNREPMAHALHRWGYNTSTANLAGQDIASLTINEDEAKAEVKKAIEAADEDIGGDVDAAKLKKALQDNKEELDKLMANDAFSDEAKKNIKKAVDFLQNVADGKIAEADVNEAGGKPKSGVMTIARGILKLLLTLIALSSSAVGLTGKLITWATKMLSTGCDKMNARLKDSEQISEAGDEEKSDDDNKDDDKADDSKDDDKDDEKSDDGEEEKKEDVEEPDEKLKDDGEDNKGSDEEKADDSKEDGEDEEKKEELSNEEKEQLKDSYKKAFKAAMKKCKFETSFSELSLEDKVEFFTVLSKAWGDKAEPSQFMTDKEVQQLEKIVVK